MKQKHNWQLKPPICHLLLLLLPIVVVIVVPVLLIYKVVRKEIEKKAYSLF